MRLKIKIFLVISIFSAFVLLYFLLPLLFPHGQLLRTPVLERFEIFSNPSANFILVIIILLLFASGLVLLFEILCRNLNPAGSKHPRLGKYLVEENFITEDELKRALKEQRFNIGEILLNDQRITPAQLTHALKVKKSTRRKIGDVLIELGYATDEDIRWALGMLERRLGDVLKDRQCISEYDLQCALSMQKFSTLDD